MNLKVYHLSKSEWGGSLQPREQDFVVDSRGACMSIPATYTRHPFKIMEIVYESETNRESASRPARLQEQDGRKNL
jgi:hypothetical protein